MNINANSDWGAHLLYSERYMPDLTGVADVLPGKLGYVTVAKSEGAATPFFLGVTCLPFFH